MVAVFLMFFSVNLLCISEINSYMIAVFFCEFINKYKDIKYMQLFLIILHLNLKNMCTDVINFRKQMKKLK